jgi:hypothetical protein
MEQQYYEAIGIHTHKTVRGYLILAIVAGCGALAATNPTPPITTHAALSRPRAHAYSVWAHGGLT